MAVITEIKENKTGNQAKVYVDGESIGIVSMEAIVRYKLKVGAQVDQEELDGYITESQIRLGFDWLVNYMGMYPCSKAKAKAKLLEKGYHVYAIEQILAKAEEYGYLDDYNFAENYAMSNINHMSKRQISSKLAENGIPSSVVQEALAQLDEDSEFEAACNVAWRWANYKDTEDVKFREKFSRYMMSKGYSWEIIGKCYAWLQEEKQNEREDI